MKLGPKYKIARRLGAPIFEKTQTQKFKMRAGERASKKPMVRSDYARQMIEKQKARFTYGVSEKQFSRYVKNVIESGTHTPVAKVFEALETRLDNVVYRLGLASTRRFARQLVSHGHILVKGRKVTIPSYVVRPGDQIGVREGSKANAVFKDLDGKMNTVQTPVWLTWNADKKQATALRLPSVEGVDMLFDLGAVIEFYKR